MKTKLTLLKNALLVGCAMFALTSCSNDDGNGLDYTTQDCAGTYKGTLSIREHGSGVNDNWYNGGKADFADQDVVVAAVSATQLKYTSTKAPASTSTFGFNVDVTVDYAGNGPDMKYFTGTGAFTVDSLKNDASQTHTTYQNCEVLAHAKPFGVRLEMVCNNAGATKGGALYYASWRKQDVEE